MPPSPLPAWARQVSFSIIDLDLGAEDESVLDAQEQARALRFKFEDLRRRFRQAHAFLRRVVGAASGRAPASLHFATTPAGRPSLVGGGPDFNLSHSGRWAAVAVAGRGRVGIDLEVRRELGDLLGVAGNVFTPEEFRVVSSAESGARLLPFYRGWTRKEALLKASGLGIANHLQATEVSLDEQARIVRVPVEMRHQRWSLTAIEAPEGVEASLALGELFES